MTKQFVVRAWISDLHKITAENGAETSLLGFTFRISWACLGTLLTRKGMVGRCSTFETQPLSRMAPPQIQSPLSFISIAKKNS